MKYSNINELDQRIERIISSTVKHYYSDWKNYDRPKYMSLKGSDKKEDKKMILIARNCGTYLLTLDAIENNRSTAAIYDYYFMYETGNYYFIDLNNLEIKKIDPESYEIKKAA